LVEKKTSLGSKGKTTMKAGKNVRSEKKKNVKKTLCPGARNLNTKGRPKKKGGGWRKGWEEGPPVPEGGGRPAAPDERGGTFWNLELKRAERGGS